MFNSQFPILIRPLELNFFSMRIGNRTLVNDPVPRDRRL
jgi:hypothetical protein